MAEVQDSGPLPDETFTLGRWRQMFGAEPAIVGDTDGSAFGLTLPPAGDVAEVGSATLESIAIVGGHPLIVPVGTTQSIEIPPSSNSGAGRTDIIAARWDPVAFNTDPGPVRLVRIAGTEGSSALPSYSSPLNFPLWAVTRKLNDALNQAASRDLRVRTGRNYDVPAVGLLPQSAPMGSRAVRGETVYRRAGVGSSVQWVVESEPSTVLTGTSATRDFGIGWQREADCRLVRDGKQRWLHLVMNRGGNNSGDITSDSRGGIGDPHLARLWDVDRPPSGIAVTMSGRVRSEGGATYGATGHITSTGNVYLNWFAPGVTIVREGPEDTVRLDAVWYVD